MSRVTEALMGGKAFSVGHSSPMLNMQYGGQMGFSPDITEYVSNQNYVRKNLICLLLEAPKFFQYMPNPEIWVGTLKSLVELHPRTIEGLNAGLTVETTTTPVGGGGEEQDEITDVKRARSQPVFTYDEKYGMPISTFFRNWITFGMMDPDSKVASVSSLAGAKPTDMLADQYAATMIFIEPDPLHQTVVKAWLTTNMFPKMTGDIIGKRDKTTAGELTSMSIEFAGISQFGAGVDALAQQLLTSISLTGSNPYNRKAFMEGIDANVAAPAFGYSSKLTNQEATAIAGL